MKNFLIIFLSLLILPAFSFEIPQGKMINKQAVLAGIEADNKRINTNPQDQSTYIDRAFLYFLIGDIQNAINDYDTLISLNPNNEEYFLNRGYLKHISHKREEALLDYEAAIKLKPNYAFAYNNKGVVLAELGRKNESLAAYNTAIQIDPSYADAYYNRGNLNTRAENNQEALEDFNTAIKLNPKDSASFNNRGVVKRKLNYNVGALSDFSIAIHLNPNDITALANRGKLKKRYFDREGAEEDFKVAISKADESPTIVKEIEYENKVLVDSKPQLKDSKMAADSIQKIASKTNYINSQDNIKTATVKASVVKVSPKSTKTTELPAPKITKSEPNITTKPVANPQLAECYYIRALQKYILQNRESAMKDFNMAIEHNPNYAEAYYYRAAIKRDYKDQGFIDDYKKAIQLKPELKNMTEADVLMILKI